MAKIVAKVGFAMRLRITLPLSPDHGMVKALLKKAEDALTPLLSRAVLGAAQLGGGLATFEVIQAQTKVEAESIDS